MEEQPSVIIYRYLIVMEAGISPSWWTLPILVGCTIIYIYIYIIQFTYTMNSSSSRKSIALFFQRNSKLSRSQQTQCNPAIDSGPAWHWQQSVRVFPLPPPVPPSETPGPRTFVHKFSINLHGGWQKRPPWLPLTPYWWREPKGLVLPPCSICQQDYNSRMQA